MTVTAIVFLTACVGNSQNVDNFLGVALDGNPIYGPNASDFPALLTSADLDACHGRYKNGRYRYHITADFPYSLGCFKGNYTSLNTQPTVALLFPM